jgi:hypothetical protein
MNNEINMLCMILKWERSEWLKCMICLSGTNVDVLRVSMVYILRYIKNSNGILGMNTYELFTIGLMLGRKYVADETYSTIAWSKLSGYSIYKINMMERHFLWVIGYDLHITECFYEYIKANLKKSNDYIDIMKAAKILQKLK